MSAPNILWICTDQQRWDSLGCVEDSCLGGLLRTPHLDALAKQGVLFTHAFCQNPVCTPSRASFLTGRYPRTTRCRQNGQALPADERLVTKLLAEAGYRGGLAGKLHISPCEAKVAPEGEKRGDDGYEVFNWSHHPEPVSSPGAAHNQWCRWLAENGRDYRPRPAAESRFVHTGMPTEWHQTTWCVNKAIGFVDETRAQGDRPWFLSVNFFDPHHPFDPPPEYLDRWRERVKDLPLPRFVPGELAGKPVWQSTDHGGAYGGRGGYRSADFSAEDHRWVRAAFGAMMELIDDQVGRLLAHLERIGERENTLVIFMSDHGEMLGDHGIYLKGPYFYDPLVRVPLIVSWPAGGLATGRSDALVELVDLAPTLCEAAGLSAHAGMQGRSLLPLLRGETGKHRDDVYSEFYNSNFIYEPRAHATMVRTATHKLVAAHGTGRGELYDLAADPHEHRNLWDDPGHLALRAELLLRLADRMAWTADPLPARQSMW